MNEWQYTNEFFEAGRDRYRSGGVITDNPYNYETAEEKDVQAELYRQNEWQAGFFSEHMLSIGAKKVS